MTDSKKKKGSRRDTISMLLIAAAIVFMGIGIVRGELAEVFLKSTNICLECIGIG